MIWDAEERGKICSFEFERKKIQKVYGDLEVNRSSLIGGERGDCELNVLALSTAYCPVPRVEYPMFGVLK